MLKLGMKTIAQVACSRRLLGDVDNPRLDSEAAPEMHTASSPQPELRISDPGGFVCRRYARMLISALETGILSAGCLVQHRQPVRSDQRAG
jgi:hypothetical protein